MKRLILILALLALPCSAFADHWVRTGTWEAGYYVACGVMDDGQPFCVNAIAYGTVEEAEQCCSVLNDEPLTLPKEVPIWFKWDDVGHTFIKVSLPCKYIAGMKM